MEKWCSQSFRPLKRRYYWFLTSGFSALFFLVSVWKGWDVLVYYSYSPVALNRTRPWTGCTESRFLVPSACLHYLQTLYAVQTMSALMCTAVGQLNIFVWRGVGFALVQPRVSVSSVFHYTCRCDVVFTHQTVCIVLVVSYVWRIATPWRSRLMDRPKQPSSSIVPKIQVSSIYGMITTSFKALKESVPQNQLLWSGS